MKRHFVMLATAASILVCGSVAASAQDDSDTSAMQQLYRWPRDDAALHAAVYERGRYDGTARDAALHEARRYDGAVRHAHDLCADGSRR